MLFPRVDTNRRRFLESVAMTNAGARFGTFGRAYAADRAPRELSALGLAVD
jgi:hypothetical protein